MNPVDFCNIQEKLQIYGVRIDIMFQNLTEPKLVNNDKTQDATKLCNILSKMFQKSFKKFWN